MTRWSTPSKRPQRITAPGPWASSATLPCVSGTPRGLISRRGRSSSGGAAASTARASTSAFITMPGPPPAGVSSTERCLSWAWLRMSMVSRLQSPAASALPARLAPSGPGNSSGKIVSTLARHMAISILLGGGVVAERAGQRIDHNPSARDVHHRNHGLGERQHESRAAKRRLHLDEIAGAEIVDRDNGTERRAARVRNRQPHEVGMIKFIRLRWREPVARDIEVEVAQSLGRGAIHDAGETRDQEILGRTQRLDRKGLRAILALEHAVVGDRHRIGGERPELDFTARAVSGADPADADALGHCRLSRVHEHQLAGAAAAFAASAALAVAAAFAAAAALTRSSA